MSEADDFFIRNQVISGTVDWDEQAESVERVANTFLDRPVSRPELLENKAGYILWLIRQLGADVEARQMAHEAATFREAGSALANLDIVASALVPSRPDGSPNRLFHSLANALALSAGPDPMLAALTGTASDNLAKELAALDRIRSGLVRVQTAYSKRSRGAVSGGAPRRDQQAEALRTVANAYSAVMGGLPTVTIGGVREGAHGHFVDVLTVVCEEVGKPGLFSEGDFRRLRDDIRQRRKR